tara:strand:- start:513 stop:635 length:123 start_codon:yes stop_codon:yes gene_type:complete
MPAGGQPFNFAANDLVSFPARMNYRWEGHKTVCKHYRFGD